MATKLKNFDFAKASNRNREFPWNQWLDGGVWRLKKGEDYHTESYSFRQTVYMAARRIGIRVTIRIEHEGMVLQAIKD